jgi:hypothetical protein
MVPILFGPGIVDGQTVSYDTTIHITYSKHDERIDFAGNFRVEFTVGAKNEIDTAGY